MDFFMRTQENAQNVKGLFPAVRRGDKQGPLTLSAEHIKRIAELWTDAGRLFAVFGLVAIIPAKGE